MWLILLFINIILTVVTFFTKWVAKLRDYHKGDNKIILHTNMDAGHSGSSGRFEALKEIAMEYAFLFMLEDIVK